METCRLFSKSSFASILEIEQTFSVFALSGNFFMTLFIILVIWESITFAAIFKSLGQIFSVHIVFLASKYFMILLISVVLVIGSMNIVCSF